LILFRGQAAKSFRDEMKNQDCLDAWSCFAFAPKGDVIDY
jgi:hypothetical protein